MQGGGDKDFRDSSCSDNVPVSQKTEGPPDLSVMNNSPAKCEGVGHASERNIDDHNVLILENRKEHLKQCLSSEKSKILFRSQSLEKNLEEHVKMFSSNGPSELCTKLSIKSTKFVSEFTL